MLRVAVARAARVRAHAPTRLLSASPVDLYLPEHLRSIDLTLPMERGRCMIIGQPRFKYPIAVVPPPAEVAPLMEAIRACEVRPFRMISYTQADGKVFNSSFFESDKHMRDWLTWLSKNVLAPGSRFHAIFAEAAGEAAVALPTPDTLLFGQATSVLTDTRFGEYQPGMAVYFSQQESLSQEAHEEMCDVAASSEFEEQVARCMLENNVAYFGRLAMLGQSASTSRPTLVTALRYGSIEDAEKGTAAVRELMKPQLSRWFGNEHTSLLGVTTKVMEL